MNAKFSQHWFVFLWVLLNFFQPRMFEALYSCCPFICVEVEHWKQNRWEFHNVLPRPLALLAKNLVKFPGRQDNRWLCSFSQKQGKTETSGRLLTHSRFEADEFLRKKWFCVTGEGGGGGGKGRYHKIISFRAELPNYTFQALYRRRQNA